MLEATSLPEESHKQIVRKAFRSFDEDKSLRGWEALSLQISEFAEQCGQIGQQGSWAVYDCLVYDSVVRGGRLTDHRMNKHQEQRVSFRVADHFRGAGCRYKGIRCSRSFYLRSPTIQKVHRDCNQMQLVPSGSPTTIWQYARCVHGPADCVQCSGSHSGQPII